MGFVVAVVISEVTPFGSKGAATKSPSNELGGNCAQVDGPVLTNPAHPKMPHTQSPYAMNGHASARAEKGYARSKEIQAVKPDHE